MSDRERIINKAKKLRSEIRQIFTDCESWNEFATARKKGEPPIDPDPYGDLRRLLAALDEQIDNDPGHGPIAPLRWERAH